MRVHLRTDERFYLWGKRIVRFTIDKETGQALLYGWRGYVGTVDPDQVPEIHNALERRKPRN
jgi:hypothetical protein